MKWLKVYKESGRFVVGSIKEKPHAKGISISSERFDNQHTVERIAVDGEIKDELNCYNGEQRNAAFQKATSYYKR